MERVIRIQKLLRVLCVALGIVALAVVLRQRVPDLPARPAGRLQIAARQQIPARTIEVIRKSRPKPSRPFAQLAGAWKLEGAPDCSAAYRLRVRSNDRLTFTGPDGTQQRETILGIEDDWLHTTSGIASSFYRLAGKRLVYRFGSASNARSETKFERCG